MYFLGMANLAILIGVPVVAMILSLARLIFGRRFSAGWHFGIWGFWTLNLISFMFVVIPQGRQFNFSNKLTSVNDFSTLNSDTLFLSLEDDNYGEALIELGDIRLGNGQLISRNVRVDVVKGEGPNFELSVQRFARGGSVEQASLLANSIDYTPIITDNKVKFQRVFIIKEGNKWRAQEVRMVLKVPEGKSIYLENHAGHIIHNLEIDRDQPHPWVKKEQVWTMEKNGLVDYGWKKENQGVQDFTNKDFRRLQLSGKMKINIEKGDQFNIGMRGKPSYLSKVEVKQVDDIVLISSGNERPTSPIYIDITMPGLEALDLQNTDDVKINGFKGRYMEINGDTKSALKMFASIDSLIIRQKGGMKLDLRGSGGYLKTILSHNSRIDAERFNVKVADVKISESCRAKVAVTDTLYQRQARTKRLKIEGAPIIIEQVEENN